MAVQLIQGGMMGKTLSEPYHSKLCAIHTSIWMHAYSARSKDDRPQDRFWDRLLDDFKIKAAKRAGFKAIVEDIYAAMHIDVVADPRSGSIRLVGEDDVFSRKSEIAAILVERQESYWIAEEKFALVVRDGV